MSCVPESTPCVPCSECPPASAYVLPDCPNGEPCESVWNARCVDYVGPNLPALGIANGDRLQTVLFKLHKVINSVVTPAVPTVSYTATNTGTGANVQPLVVTYLGLGQGGVHQAYTINVLPGTPQTFTAFVNSHVKVSGVGTIV